MEMNDGGTRVVIDRWTNTHTHTHTHTHSQYCSPPARVHQGLITSVAIGGIKRVSADIHEKS